VPFSGCGRSFLRYKTTFLDREIAPLDRKMPFLGLESLRTTSRCHCVSFKPHFFTFTSHFSRKILISSQKFSFLHLQFSFLPKSSHFFPKVLISSQKFSFLHLNSHFFPKVLISSQEFSFLHKSSHFLKCRSHFVTLAAHFSRENLISWNAGAVSPFLAARRLCRPVFRSCRALSETGRRDSTSRESFTCNSRRSQSHRAQLFEISRESARRKSGIHAERSPALSLSRTESKRAARSPSRALRPGASFTARLSGIKWADGDSAHDESGSSCPP
jgi:hypothetical protein